MMPESLVLFGAPLVESFRMEVIPSRFGDGYVQTGVVRVKPVLHMEGSVAEIVEIPTVVMEDGRVFFDVADIMRSPSLVVALQKEQVPVVKGTTWVYFDRSPSLLRFVPDFLYAEGDAPREESPFTFARAAEGSRYDVRYSQRNNMAEILEAFDTMSQARGDGSSIARDEILDAMRKAREVSQATLEVANTPTARILSIVATMGAVFASPTLDQEEKVMVEITVTPRSASANAELPDIAAATTLAELVSTRRDQIEFAAAMMQTQGAALNQNNQDMSATVAAEEERRMVELETQHAALVAESQQKNQVMDFTADAYRLFDTLMQRCLNGSVITQDFLTQERQKYSTLRWANAMSQHCVPGEGQFSVEIDAANITGCTASITAQEGVTLRGSCAE